MDATDLGTVGRDGTGSELPKPVTVFACQHAFGPAAGGLRDGIEIVCAAQAAACAVVVAADEDTAEAAGFVDHLVRVSSVTNEVAEVPDHVVCGGGGQDGCQALPVRVNVGDNKSAH